MTLKSTHISHESISNCSFNMKKKSKLAHLEPMRFWRSIEITAGSILNLNDSSNSIYSDADQSVCEENPISYDMAQREVLYNETEG